MSCDASTGSRERCERRRLGHRGGRAYTGRVNEDFRPFLPTEPTWLVGDSTAQAGQELVRRGPKTAAFFGSSHHRGSQNPGTAPVSCNTPPQSVTDLGMVPYAPASF